MTAIRPQSSFRGNIVRTLKVVAASKSTWFFAAVWLASVLVLVAGGHTVPVAGIVVGSVLLLLSLLVTEATEPTRAVIAVAGPAHRRVWVQLGLVVVFIALTGRNNLAFHNVIDGNADIPFRSSYCCWQARDRPHSASPGDTELGERC